jgi:hypothetical protein
MKLVRRILAMGVFAAVILPAGLAFGVTVPAQSFLAVSFSDLSHGYIAGGYSDIDGVLAVTSDGGVTWRPTQFPNRRTWAVGSSTDGSSATASADYFDTAIATTNSGGTWASGTPVFGGVLGFAGTSHINDVAYLSGGRVAVGQQEGTASNGNVAVIAQEVGGIWTPDFFPLYPPLIDGTPVPSFATLTSIDATAGGSIAWAVGTEYSLPQNAQVKSSLVYKTTDGGATWAADAGAGPMLAELSAVTAVDANVMFATQAPGGVGSRKIRRRSAAGAWDEVTTALGFQANALDAYDADHLVVVGDAGKIYYTANAQASTPTWAALTTTGSTNNLYGVQMTGPGSWTVVGGNETNVRFTNDGATQAGSYGLGNPVPVILAPTSGFSRPVAAINGTASDSGSGVLKVEVRIQRANGDYWTGATWVSDVTGNRWNSASGTTSWSYTPLPSETSNLTISVRATDGMGLQATTAVNSSGAGIDLTPPTTTSDAGATYSTSGGTIKLTASDNAGGSGVASTWYRLGGSGAYTQGTSIPVPTTAGSYTLYFYSVDVAGNAESPAKTATFQVSSAPTALYKPVYRFRNLKNGFYLWSADEAEKNTIITTLYKTWLYEGTAYRINTANPLNQSPLWRFVNIKGGYYLYSADPAEKASIIANLSKTWKFEGEAYKVSTNPAGAPVWRFRNIAKGATNGTYLYSADVNEKNTIVATLGKVWQLEGPAYYLAP